VTKQTPDGAKLKEKSIITLSVSKGAEKQLMQSYKDRLFKDVKAELVAAGLKDDQILSDAVYSELPVDTVVSQEPAVGTVFDPVNGKVKFFISKGRQTVIMPDLLNSTVAEAEAKLMSVGLKLAAGDKGRENVESFDIASGRVVDTHPFKKGEAVDPSMEIKLFVSSGPPKDAVPYTSDKKLTAANSGKSSIFRIVISDARVENQDYNTMEVAGSELTKVKVTLTKEKGATILIYRDNVLWDSETINYQNYLDQKTKPSATPTATPSASPSASASPAATKAAPSGSVKPSPSPAGG
jgi:serine/threonine-protein kinase